MNKNSPQNIAIAIRSVFTESRLYQLLFAGLSTLFFLGYLLTPFFITYGLAFKSKAYLYLQYVGSVNYVIFAVLSLATALLMTMQIFIFIKNRKTKKMLGVAAHGGVSLFGAFTVGLFSTATCSACALAVFGFLGASSIFFIFDHRLYVIGVVILILAAGIYLTARKIHGGCSSCDVK